jgi:tetratricopeptide (TPR) repeat protein
LAIAHGKIYSLIIHCEAEFYSRYLYELGDYDVSGRVIETALSAYEDKTSLLYALLVDTAGSRFFDLNRLSECRTAWETVLRIRKDILSHDDPYSKYAKLTLYDMRSNK